MMREAHTADQYKDLAAWFRKEEAKFRSKAEAEERDYVLYKDRFPAAKYPTPAESARALSDYYLYKANKMAAIADRYDKQLSRTDLNHPGSAMPGSSTPGEPFKNGLHSQSQSDDMLERTEAQERQAGRSQEW